MLELRKASLASLATSLLSSLSSSISQMEGHTLKSVVIIPMLSPATSPGEVEEDTGTEEPPLLGLLDGQSEDPLEAETEDGEAEVPVVLVPLHVHHSGGEYQYNHTGSVHYIPVHSKQSVTTKNAPGVPVF